MSAKSVAGDPILIIEGVEVGGLSEVAQVVFALEGFCGGFGAGQGRQQQACQNCDDGDDDKQFNEGERPVENVPGEDRRWVISQRVIDSAAHRTRRRALSLDRLEFPVEAANFVRALIGMTTGEFDKTFEERNSLSR